MRGLWSQCAGTVPARDRLRFGADEEILRPMVASPPPRRLTAGLMCGVAVHAMAAYAVATALPTVTEALEAPWAYGPIITVYMLASVIGLAEGGRRADHRGLVATVRAGAGWITAGLLLAALAPNAPVLLVGRALQGFGAGLLTTVVYAIVHTAYPRQGWSNVLALLSAAWGVAGVGLPPLLGLIVDIDPTWTWRIVFVAPLPLLALTVAWVTPCIPAGREPGSEPAESVRVLDAVGVVFGASLLLHPLPFVPAGLSMVQAAAGLAIVGHSVARLLPEGTLTLKPVLGGAIGAKFLVCMGFFGAEVFVPLALREVHGKGGPFIGLVLTGATVAWALAAFVQTKLLPRIGPARCGTIGSTMIFVGVAGLVLITEARVPVAWVFLTWGIAAAGMGISYSTVTDSAMAATPAGREGATGMALGIVDVLGAAAGAGLGQVMLGAFPAGEAGTALGLRAAWAFLALLTGPAIWASTRLGSRMENKSAPASIELAATEP